MKNLLNQKGKNLAFGALMSLVSIGAAAQNPFVTEWDVTSPASNGNFEITIPTHHGNQYNYNYDVDWDNDGVYDDIGVTSDITHNYGSPGVYEINIRGEFPAIRFNNKGDKDRLLEIKNWGDIEWKTFSFAFAGCSNLVITAGDAPILNEVSDLSYMFHKATSLNSDLNHWDVDPVIYMRGTFSEASSFNGDISTWNTSNVQDMTSMFESAVEFNGHIEDWNTDGLREMTYIFSNAKVFNRPIGGWNITGVTNLNGVFSKAVSFNQPLPWELVEVRSMHNMFSGATAFNQPLYWNTENVIDMSHMFEAASAFDQDLGDWPIVNVQDMSYMLSASNLSACNYEATLIGWANNGVNPSIILGADGLYYFDDSGRNNLLANGWQIKGDDQSKMDKCGLVSPVCNVGSSTFFKTTWLLSGTSVANRSITIPATGGGYNFDVDWNNDGVFDDLGVTSNITHTYNNDGTKKISIRGTFPRMNMYQSPDAHKITSIDQWGCIQWSTFHRSFQGCVNVVENATDAPDLSNVSDLSFMFSGATSLTGDMNNWDVSTITDMNGLFLSAAAFNGDISSWNTANVVNMSSTFHNASVFNSNISGWNTSSNTSLNSTFKGATAFNQDIGNWDVSNVTSLWFTFLGASSFNQDLNSWNTGNVTTMVNTFYQASSFNNGDSGNNENNPLDNWDVSNVNDMSSTFRSCPFNQDIGSWDVNNVVNMYHTFAYNSAFDQDISGWDVSNVSALMATFSGATSFNQDISGWDVSNVSNMYRTFHGASSFDQNLGSWDLSSVGTGNAGTLNSMNLFFNGSGMLLANYDNTFIGWATNPNTPNDVYYSADGKFYCNADATIVAPGQTALDVLNTKNWNSGNIKAINIHDLNCAAPRIKYNNTIGTGTSTNFAVFGGSGTNDLLRIKANKILDVNTTVTATIYDMNGKLIYAGTVAGGDDTISTSNFSKGVYLVKIESGSEVETQKVMIQ